MADAIITLGGCDKTVPGALMPIPRMNAIGITLFGGPALPGHCQVPRTVYLPSDYSAAPPTLTGAAGPLPLSRVQ